MCFAPLVSCILQVYLDSSNVFSCFRAAHHDFQPSSQFISWKTCLVGLPGGGGSVILRSVGFIKECVLDVES